MLAAILVLFVCVRTDTALILVCKLADVAALALVSAKTDTELIRVFTEVIAALLLLMLVAKVELKDVTLLFTDVIAELLFAILVAIVELTAAILVSSVADVLALAYVAASRTAIAEELAATDV